MATSKKLTSTVSLPAHLSTYSSNRNIRLLWLDQDFDNEDSQNSVRELQKIIDTINTYTNVNKCIKSIDSFPNEKLYLIFSGTLGETTVPLIHDRLQVDTIYIFCQNKPRHDKWAKNWSKIKGVHTNIQAICAALKQTYPNDDDLHLVSISFVQATAGDTKKSLDELDNSFMYTQILKEILLTIDFEPKHFREFLDYCRKTHKDKLVIDKIEEKYDRRDAIYWYSYDCFLYSMVNRDLRLMNIDGIIKTGFFIRDLHNHIAQLHSEQFNKYNNSKPFIVYRSQNLLKTDFDKMIKTKGGLLSFNHFVSTSKIQKVSLEFTRSTEQPPNMVRILFTMTIDPSKSSTPFANISHLSNFKTEAEILFSMHSIFRVGQIKQSYYDGPLWEVNLTLTNDSDPQLSALTECILNETKGSTGWCRLGKLMVKLAQYEKAESLYYTLLIQKSNEHDRGNIFHQLGLIKYHRADYANAISQFEKSLDYYQKTSSSSSSSDEANIAECYNDIGLVYYKTGEFSKALKYYEKALEIRKNVLSRDHPDIAESYNNIGSVHDQTGDNRNALSFFEKAWRIYQKHLPSNHPNLAASYNNIGSVHYKMENYSEACSFLEKALEINQKILSPNHPDLAASYNNIAMVYVSMNEHPKALSYYQKALEILKSNFAETHPHIAATHVNIGRLYEKMNEYSKALASHEKALNILKKCLTSNHPDLACCYGHIGIVYSKMGNHNEAVASCEHALKIAEKSLSSDHPQLQSYRKNLEIVKRNL